MRCKHENHFESIKDRPGTYKNRLLKLAVRSLSNIIKVLAGRDWFLEQFCSVFIIFNWHEKKTNLILNVKQGNFTSDDLKSLHFIYDSVKIAFIRLKV